MWNKTRIGLGVAVIWFAAGLGALACGPTSSARAPGAAALNFRVEQRKLKNGIRFVTHSDPSQGLVAAVLVVGAGAGHDPAGKEGLAHVVEHLMFREMTDEKSTTVRLEQIGATFNAWTNIEETAFHAVAPAAERAALLQIMADIARGELSKVDQPTFVAERNIVENERRVRNENGYPAEIFSRLDRALYGDSYQGRSVIGSPNSLEGLTLEDAQDFTRKFYDPRRMTLLVAGDLGPDAAKLADPFQELTVTDPAPITPPPPVVEPEAKDAPIERIQASVGTPELWLAWRLPGAYDQNRSVLDALDAFAGESFRGTRDDVVSVSTFVETGPNVSTLYARTLVTSTSALDAVRFYVFHGIQTGIADLALDRDWRTIFTREESTRRMLRNEWLGPRSVEMALGAHYASDPLFEIKQADALADVDGDAVRELSKKYLIEKRGRALLVEPGAGDAGALPQAQATSGGGHDRTNIEAAEETVRLKPGALQKKVLDNGLTVLALERPGSPFFTALLGFMDGAARTPSAVAEAADMSIRTYIQRPPAGVSFGRSTESDSVQWFVRSNISALDIGLDGLYDRLTHHEIFWKPATFLDWLKVAEKSEKPLTLANRDLRHALLGASVLVSPAPRDLDPVTVQNIRDWRDAVYRPENGALVIVGPEASHALAVADEYMSSWKRGASRKPAVKPAPRVDAHAHEGFALSLTNRPDLTQTELVFGCLLPESNESTAPKEDVLAGLLSAKLEWQIRERAGSTYNLGADVDRARGGLALLSLTTSVANESLDMALPILLDAMTNKVSIVGDDTVSNGRWIRFRDLAQNGGTTTAFSTRIFDYFRLGWPVNALETYPDRVQKVSTKEVVDLMQYCSEHLALTAFGDGDRVRRLSQDYRK